MFFKVIVLFMAILFSGLATGQENPVPLDFDQTLEMVYANDYGLKAKRDAAMAAEYRVKEKISQYYPKLSAYSNISRTSLQSEIELPNPLGGTLNTIRLFPQERYNFGLIGRYELYTFGRRAAIKSIARMGLEISKLEKQEFKSILYDKTARAFSRTILARHILIIQNQNIKRAQDKLRIIEDRVNQGLAAEYDRVAAKILLSRYREKESQARAEFQKAKIGLKALTDWKFPYDFMPVGELAELKASLPESTSIEPNRTASIKRMMIGRDMLDKERKIRKSSYFPGIGAFTKYDWQNGYQPEIDKIRGDWSVGISLEWTLLDGGFRKSRVMQSDFEISGAAHLVENARTELTFAAESAEVEIERASQKLSLAGERLRLIDDGIQIAQARYDQGFLGISDLLDLDLDKSEAEIARVSADFELFLAKLDYKKALDYYPEAE